jgi:hypothetical protein
MPVLQIMQLGVLLLLIQPPRQIVGIVRIGPESTLIIQHTLGLSLFQLVLLLEQGRLQWWLLYF